MAGISRLTAAEMRFASIKGKTRIERIRNKMRHSGKN
jgi:hypothetical protein